MDRTTIEVYEHRGEQWAARRRPVRRREAQSFAGELTPGEPRIDLGCGAGRYTGDLGQPVIALDASPAMLALCRRRVPGAALVAADLEALPVRGGCLGGGWANMSYLHVPRVRLPMALADLHRAMAVGGLLDVQVVAGSYEGYALPDDDLGGRFFAAWEPEALADVLVGAGFAVRHVTREKEVVRARAVRERTLADTVGPDMAVLVVGLNPSLYAADAGVGYARPGNRFWPAATAAGLVSGDRDPVRALRVDGVGMTDVVKRSTTSADQLSRAEYAAGMARLDRLARWLAPGLVCMVGLTGWRRAVDAQAPAGVQSRRLGGRPVYVMPSTSGANAHATPAALTSHLRTVVALSQAPPT